MDYELELKQIVDFPRCRMYREFIRTLIADKSIRTNGCSYLFYYIVLCSYANYRTSYNRIDGIVYTVSPGEWVCHISELQVWFRCRFQHQVLSILQYFEEQHYITYSILGKNKIIKFKISDWQKDNTVLEYNYPCKKNAGFFFFTIAKVHELISIGKCSEMDIILDLWIHAIYNDPSVQGSQPGPVVYYRNNTHNPLVNYQSLGERWGISKASVSRMLKKLEEKEYITLINFKGRHGSVIYLNNYLSVMFNVSDVMIDKEEVAMTMQLPIHIPDSEEPSKCVSKCVTDDQLTVSENNLYVPKPHMKYIIQKVVELLDSQGIPCCHCEKTEYILSPLSDCKSTVIQYALSIICPFGNMKYQFELTLTSKSPDVQFALQPQQECIKQEGRI